MKKISLFDNYDVINIIWLGRGSVWDFKQIRPKKLLSTYRIRPRLMVKVIRGG